MPGLEGFRCPPFVPSAGRSNTIDFCLGECEHQCASPGLLAAIYKADTENHHTGTYISISMLTKNMCARQTVFERTQSFFEIPLKRYWSFRGTVAHGMVEKAVGLIEDYGWIPEMRMAVPLVFDEYPAPVFDEHGVFTGEWDTSKPLIMMVGGTCDLFNPVRRILWDLKSMADRKADMMVSGEKSGTYSSSLEDSWVEQLNGYRWLIANTPVPDEYRKKFQLTTECFPAPETLNIQGISMMEIPRTDSVYQLRSASEAHTIDAVPVWSLEETEQWIRKGALQWYKWLVLGEPTKVVPKSKDWLCKGCAFNGERIAGAPCHPKEERARRED